MWVGGGMERWVLAATPGCWPAARPKTRAEALRYCERRGVLPPPLRLPSGYRTYAPSSVDRIVLARRLRAVGMSIDEIVSALAAHDGGATCGSQVWPLEAVRVASMPRSCSSVSFAIR
jgi:DNA-binding transcriptional MerR regulator